MITTSLAFLLAGFLAWRSPGIGGGDFKFVKALKRCSIKFERASNSFVLKYTKTIGFALIISGIFMTICSMVYLLNPEAARLLTVNK